MTIHTCTRTHTPAKSKFKSDCLSDESYFKHGYKPIFHKTESEPNLSIHGNNDIFSK